MSINANLQPQVKDYAVIRNNKRYAGVHLIIDLYGASRLDDIDHIENTLRHCVDEAGATLLHIHLHPFKPNGISGVAVIAESHITVHTWPEDNYVAFDVFMCGNTDPNVCIDIMKNAFSAERVEVQEILRGEQK